MLVYRGRLQQIGEQTHVEPGLHNTRLYVETVVERMGLDDSDRPRAGVGRASEHALDVCLREHGRKHGRGWRRHAGDECRSL